MGSELWQRLLRTDPEAWKDIYNEALRDERRQMKDAPVPKAVVSRDPGHRPEAAGRSP